MGERIATFRRALDRCVNLTAQFPHVRALESIERQLTYLIDLEEGRRTDRENLKRVSIGILAIREIETLDSELFSLLIEAASEADRM